MIHTEKIEVSTKKELDVINITDIVQQALSNLGAKEGFVMLFLQSTTSALMIIEDENGLISDLKTTAERLAPKSAEYEHEKAYRDGNGHSHMRSTIIGVDLTVPFSNGSLLLGTWQQIILMEFDVRPRKRSVILQIVTE